MIELTTSKINMAKLINKKTFMVKLMNKGD
jgi:hypothetical protein